MPTQVRIASITERALLVELQRRASLANPADREALLAHPDAIDIPPAQFEAGHVCVAESSGALVGFSAIELRADGDAELDGLFVEPDRWNGGHGRTLVAAAVALACTRGAQRLHVVANPHALAFYAKVGFVPSGRTMTRFGPAQTMVLSIVPGDEAPARPAPTDVASTDAG